MFCPGGLRVLPLLGFQYIGNLNSPDTGRMCVACGCEDAWSVWQLGIRKHRMMLNSNDFSLILGWDCPCLVSRAPFKMDKARAGLS